MKAIGLDINWLYMLGNNHIHALSGGGRLPMEIDEMDKADLDKLIKKALSTQKSYEYEINPYLEKFINVSNEQAIDILSQFKIKETVLPPVQQYINRFYVRPFIRFASVGYISFDKTNLNDPEDCHYHIVAYPKFVQLKECFIPESNLSFEELLSLSLDLSTIIHFSELQ